MFLHAASGAEKAAAKGDLNIVYKITKQLIGGQSNTYTKPVKDKEGNVLTKREQGSGWVRHFKGVLNRTEPNEPSEPDPLDDLNINTDPPHQPEGETATKAVKNGKASGIDSLHAEFIT